MNDKKTEIVRENVCGLKLWRVYENDSCIGAFSLKRDAIKYAKGGIDAIRK